MEKTKKNSILSKGKIIIFILLLITIVVCSFLIFRRTKIYTITFDSNGGSSINSLEVKKETIETLPENPTKEGYTFVGWINEEGKLFTLGTKITKDITLKAEWIHNESEMIMVEFNTDGGNKIDDITIDKGHIALLPIEPTKKGYIFVCWVDEDNNYITDETIITDNMTLKAIWIKKGNKTSTIKFDSDGGSKIGSIIVENDKRIILPINPTKSGYVFAGWVDENGNKITKDTLVKSNITIKATWKTPYTCPSGCTPTGDGSKCTKETTKEMSNKSSCPSGYTLKNGKCVNMSSRYHANNTDSGWKCNSSRDYMYSEIDSSGMGAYMWCVKTTNKVTTKVCPSGYKQSGNICKKIETLKCTAN